MPQDSDKLRADLIACMPSLVIDQVAATSGQRVVYFGYFDDSRIPADIPDGSAFLHGWQAWGRVVVKVVAGASADALTRLEAECRILREVKPAQFPTLLFSNLFVENPVTDDALTESLYVSIEEFVDSNTLSELLDAHVGSPREVARIAMGIAEALDPLWSHPRQFVHRDIKPANVLLKLDGTVVVIDLGIVRETGGIGITREGWGKAPLTVDYAAPEQIANDKDAISFKTDFFAIGVLMYRMLSGAHPFRLNGSMYEHEVAQAIESQPHRPLIELGCADDRSCSLVEALLRKAPYQRPRTPAVLIKELKLIQGGVDMSVRLLHQVGHNAKWNIQSFEDEGCGYGLVLSPLHQSKEAVEKLSAATRAASIFDPQFYLPSSQKPKLLQYPFFPESVGGGFKTSSFKSHAVDIAKQCLGFQKELGFRRLVVPTRFIDQLYTDYVDRQKAFTVDAFMEVAGSEPLSLSLAVTAPMIEDHAFRTKLLNWITSYPTVDHVYLMYQQARDTKQVVDSAFLRSAYDFFAEIQSTGLALTVGYTNSECLMYSMLEDIELTVGAFENTRIFSIDKFLVSEEDRRGPKARIYLPGLLNWVQFGDAREIRQKAPKVWQAVYEATEYSEQALAQAVEPTFNQPPLYKHYFQVMHREFEALSSMNSKARVEYLRSRVATAMHRYQDLQNANVYLERHGQGGHLPGWSDYLSGLKT